MGSDQQQDPACPNCRGEGEVLSSWQWIDPRRVFQQGIVAVPTPTQNVAPNTTQVNFVDTPIQPATTQTIDYMNIITPR